MKIKNYFISIPGKCNYCGYPVICDAGETCGDKDYHLFCSNPNCINHKGVVIYDSEIEEVTFLKSNRGNFE